MSLKILVPLAWTSWTILFGALLTNTVIAAREDIHTPEVGAWFNRLLYIVLYILVLGAGGILYGFTKSHSFAGLLSMAIILGYGVVMLIAQPGIRFFDNWRFERELARVGDFREPTLRPLAEAIRAGDSAALSARLGGKPPPSGRDRAGYDLLGFALAEYRSGQSALDCVRTLLAAGCDARTTRMPDGGAPIHFMIVDITPRGREAVLLLLEHGADPNAVDPTTGNTPIRGAGHSPELVRALVEAGADMDRIQPNGVTALIDFVAQHHWESALCLVERGARLDVANENGLSLDYYLESWRDSVFGNHPEGWDRLRTAIAARGHRPSGGGR